MPFELLEDDPTNNVVELSMARATSAALNAVYTALERQPTDAERDYAALRKARKEHFDQGCRLNRMAREAAESARECFETVIRIDEQLQAAAVLLRAKP